MKRTLVFVAFVLAFSLTGETAYAGGTFNDDFESYADQAALDATWGDIPGRAGITLGTDGGNSGSNYLQLPASLARKELNFSVLTPSDATPYIFEFEMRCKSASQGDDYVEIIKWENTLPNNVVRLGDGPASAGPTNNFMANVWIRDGNGVGSDYDSGWLPLGGPAQARGVDVWHNLEAHLYSDNIDFYVDDVYCTTVDLPMSGIKYELMYIGAEAHSTTAHDVDDARMEEIPTPTVTPTETPVPDTPTPSSGINSSEYSTYE